MGPAIMNDEEMLVSGWRGSSASAILVTRLEEETSEYVFSQARRERERKAFAL
jgi:hypothetical protein